MAIITEEVQSAHYGVLLEEKLLADQDSGWELERRAEEPQRVYR